MAGLISSEIVEIHPDGSLTVLTQGHSEGELWGLADHPTSDLFVTGSDDGTLRLWDSQV